MHRFDPADLLLQLSSLPRSSQVAFALSCAERLALAATSPSGLTDEARRLAYRFVLGDKAEESVLERELTSLEAAAELDDDGHAAAFYSLQCCYRGAQSAVWAAQRAYDFSDLIAQADVSDVDITEDTEQKLLSHAAVQTELGRQARDLCELAQGSRNDLVVVDRARSGGSEA